MNDRFGVGDESRETLLFLRIAFLLVVRPSSLRVGRQPSSTHCCFQTALAHCCMVEMEHQWRCRHISYAEKAG
jgi:hypothetical protein